MYIITSEMRWFLLIMMMKKMIPLMYAQLGAQDAALSPSSVTAPKPSTPTHRQDLYPIHARRHAAHPLRGLRYIDIQTLQAASSRVHGFTSGASLH